MPEYGFTVSVNNLASAKMKEIEASLASMGVKAKVETKEVAEDFEFMGERMGETFKNLKSLLLTGLGITALFEGWEFIEKSKEAFEGLEKAVTKVDTVLKSTHFAAGFSSEDIQDQAKELSKEIVNKRDEILDAQGMLLSFHDIKGPKFTETMKSVADFATFYKEDMTQAALQVGKAINDPLKGMTRLQRMGVEFSAEQKQQITNYIQQGELAKAQEVILKELRTEFGGQAQAFALTDAGKIQVAAKQWEELQFSIGEIVSKVEVSLIPAFTKVVNVIKGTFNTGVIQFFIEHIKDLVSIALRLIPIWVAYRTIMAANAAITSVFAIENGVLTASMGSLTFMTDGATVAFEGFSAALASTGVGLLVIGIGLLIEKLISVNNEFNKSIEKITRLDELTNKADPTLKAANDEWTKFAFGKLENKEKGLLLKDVRKNEDEAKERIKENETQRSAIASQIADAKKQYAKMPEFSGQGGGATANQEKILAGEKIDELTNQMRGLAMINIKLHSATVSDELVIKNYTKQNEAIIAYNKLHPKNKKELIQYTDPSTGSKTDATNTSNLSGANGGLGQAKIIQIHINTLQQNNGVHESKSKADETVRMLTEYINGFSDSQNAQ